jgi:hypothetical protein
MHSLLKHCLNSVVNFGEFTGPGKKAPDPAGDGIPTHSDTIPAGITRHGEIVVPDLCTLLRLGMQKKSTKRNRDRVLGIANRVRDGRKGIMNYE